MRKFIFAALAGVFMLSSGFTGNVMIEENPPGMCYYSITQISIDLDGTRTSETKNFSVYMADGSEALCELERTRHITALEQGWRNW